MSTAIFLCDYTGNMAAPWVASGYTVILVDTQHPEGITRQGNIIRVGKTIIGCADMIGSVVKRHEIAFVAGFPPCTDVSLSGARHWKAKRERDPYFQVKAAIVAEQCRMVGMLSGAPWFFENPKSAFSKVFGKPNHKFHPWQYTGYEKNDNYRKETWLWSGGGFVMPTHCLDITLGPPDDRIHKCAPSPERANIRSATPIGFARAVFEANCK